MDKINYAFTGAKEQEQKATDFSLGSVVSADPIPESYMTPYTSTIYHQHQIPACGSHAGTYIKNIQESKDMSPEYLWKRIKQIDGFKPEEGTTMIAIFKALQQHGVCSLALMPNSTLDTIEQYTDPSTITPAMDIDALGARIGLYAFKWTPTFDDVKRAIYEHQGAIMLLRIGQEWWTPSWQEQMILPLKPDAFPISSGHFVTAIGYDKQYIYFLNEWGTGWGRKGIGYFGANYAPRISQVGTCFDYNAISSVVYTRTMRLGDKGTDVGILQKYLQSKGFFPVTQKITSYFGPITFSSVVAFQTAHGLVADGVVGKNTIAMLK